MGSGVKVMPHRADIEFSFSFLAIILEYALDNIGLVLIPALPENND